MRGAGHGVVGSAGVAAAPPGTGVLSWAPPSTAGYTTYNIPTGGGSVTLNNSTDYVLVSPAAAITGPLQFTGGRNIVWIGGILGGRKTQPDLYAGGYDSTNRGVRFYDGADSRTIFIQGIYGETGTYFSDFIQIAMRTTNNVTFYIQDIRNDGINWGYGASGISTDVHADAIQCWGGPTNMFIDGVTMKNLTYQGMYWDPGDGRTLPSGARTPWQVRNMNLVGNNLTGEGVRYLLVNRESAFTAIQNTNVYTLNQGNSATDSFGEWPSAGLTQSSAPPGGDFVPVSRWNLGTYVYTNPGYVS